jgi:hypothetical protein
MSFAKTRGEIKLPDDERLIPDWDEYKALTSFVSQALDLQKGLAANVIWTAHPLPSIKVEGSGNSIRVTKTNPIVTYGGKVAGIIPNAFTEIYHFSQQQDWTPGSGQSSKKYICSLDSIGDEFAKSPLLGHRFKELDFTNRLFYEVWKEAYDIACRDIKSTESNSDSKQGENNQSKPIDPFVNQKKW